jgi:hypothetical protein
MEVTVHTIDLAYVGRGVHEELVAHVADQEGYFGDEGVHVAVHDGTGWGEERLRSCATIGLGRGVLARLTEGIPWTVPCPKLCGSPPRGIPTRQRTRPTPGIDR